MSDIGVFANWKVELLVLLLAIVLGVVLLCVAAVAARRQQGLAWARGPRDEPRPVTGVAARLERAFANFMETFPFFAAAVLAVVVLDETGRLSAWGSGLYLLGRVLHAPLYAAGVPTLRTLAWAVATTGLLLVVVQAFL
jgi:uncharacterized MAPEG superfamily protein